MSVKRFSRLLAIRKMQEHEATLNLAGRIGDLTRAEEQRDRLTEYQNLYLNALIPNDARMLKQMALMRQQLREALNQQELRIKAAQTRVEQARVSWQERHQASLSLEKLIARRRREDSILEERRAQREIDLWVTRKSLLTKKL